MHNNDDVIAKSFRTRMERDFSGLPSPVVQEDLVQYSNL